MQEKINQPTDTDPINGAISSRYDIQDAGRHSEDIQEIITKVPSWILRWGIVIWGMILVIGIAISAIIHYPDTIKAPIKFQSAPKETYGLIAIREDNFTKVKTGQQVTIGLQIYPAEDYGQLRGTIAYIPDQPNERGVFIVQVKLDSTHLKQPIKLKNWMTGNAEIITQDITILQRITHNLVKGVNKN